MGNLILEQNLFGLMMDIICKDKTENESVRRLYGKIMYILLSKKWLVPDIDTAESIAETVCHWLIASKAKIGNKIWCLNILQILNPQVKWITEVMENIIAKESISPTPGIKCAIRKLRQ